MIIAIPLDETKQNVCISFGRAPYFLFHNTGTKTSQTVENAAAQAQGGAGVKAAQLVVDSHADAVITIRCGQNSAEVLQAAKIAVYKAMSASAADNLLAFAEGKLSKLDHFHPGFHGLT